MSQETRSDLSRRSGRARLGRGRDRCAIPGPSYLAVGSFVGGDVNANRVDAVGHHQRRHPTSSDSFISNDGESGRRPGLGRSRLGQALVVTIHPVIGRDSHQNPAAWHAHTVQLAGGATAPNDFCLAAITSTPTAGIQLQGSQMRVNVAAEIFRSAAASRRSRRLHGSPRRARAPRAGSRFASGRLR